LFVSNIDNNETLTEVVLLDLEIRVLIFYKEMILWS